MNPRPDKRCILKCRRIRADNIINQPGFQEDEGWHEPVMADRPRGTAKMCGAEPIAVLKEVKPVKIWKGCLADYEPRKDVLEGLNGGQTPESGLSKEGGYIYDFGDKNA